ncbi:Glycosyltransferase involved in cell wall bisynthesis [Atopostipes suicloacalis DSM 15692]|uniref:Glycosyltransferase involved in cell wall bisynthesis n=1 Tax=Atopostipes suicloacalis DSM 15692 TaxID=1121025 RepID=A0A1M4X371_9LACT|nr:glycosyltransferase family 4 protein [Atopostipes suicloacalis]SHE87672.1 Glycosyltransferase involved in cell wall bisynthesis [Atopostipes suicloacalis DSM 15692]
MANVEVMLCSDHSLDTIGGAQLSSNIILNGLKNDNYNIGVIQPGKNSSKMENIEYFEIGEFKSIKTVARYPFKFINYIKQVRKILNKEKPSIVHTQAQANFFIVAFLKKLHLISKETYIIHTERGLYLKYNAFIKQVFRFLMNELDILITTTQFNMNYWQAALEKWNISLDDYKIIENTAGEYFENYDENYVSPYRDKLVLGFVGRWNYVKNWPLAKEIALTTNEKLGDSLIVKMAISCDDEEAEKEAKHLFSQLEEQMGGRFQGAINTTFNKMDQFYYDMDVYILTTLKDGESFGRTIVEAMSRNTVVMTTNAGGPVEVVDNDQLVLDTADDFAEEILYYFENPKKMEETKKNNRQRVKEVYSLDNNLVKHKELYTNILNR